MQRNIGTLKGWAPIAAAIAVALLIVALYDNGAPGHGAIDPTFGLTALAALFGGAATLIVGLLPIMLTVVAGYFLVRWWLAPEGATAVGAQRGDLAALFGGSRATEIACPACAMPVRDRWQACPGCGYRMHVINATPSCPTCHLAVDRDWHVCPHCASKLPIRPDEERVPARAMVEAARLHAPVTAALAPKELSEVTTR
jgi:RNA polymerase subunit RPABC4/transcription elongation factor Spt4